VILLIIAIAGGAIVHPILFVLGVLALVLFVMHFRSRGAAYGPPQASASWTPLGPSKDSCGALRNASTISDGAPFDSAALASSSLLAG
jgi:hypothetical protein